ncbi:NAD(+) synthase [Chitinispirillales bacterium ANBcel5]|uniref:NAD(+) synthase n=1 Tax=Cellulosispirillum alkaliphilum TaxID=3039283 RepID=UPI002A53AC0B|nr:NAD(+) synthase [Chitinispirillales bacterium ANBcel5]
MLNEATPLSGENKSGKVVSHNDLLIDAHAETQRICSFINNTLVQELKKRGAVIGLSGGIDSSVTAALCVKALGPDRVFGVLMPERHSAAESSSLGKIVAHDLGIKYTEHNITPILEASGCYVFQNEAIRSVIPEYEASNPFKVVMKRSNGYNISHLVVEMPDGSTRSSRMDRDAYLKLVAATNFKQRARKMLEYYHGDRLHYAVAGSPNRLEFDQGFFVKNGDGSADFKPIAHLYKSQVYQIGRYLNIPQTIVNRLPTTDTYPMEQSQEEFYFSLPYEKMDLCLWAKNNRLPPKSVCQSTELTVEQARSVYDDIDSKRKATRYGHLKAFLVDNLPELI